MSADVVTLRRNEPISLDDLGRLRWKLHLLSLALDGLIHGGNMTQGRDLDALWWLAFEMNELLPEDPEPEERS